MQSNQENQVRIVAIFRPGDPFRGIVRQYAVAAGGRLFFYDHSYQALSRMPLPDDKHTLAVICRAETLTEDIASALASLSVPNQTHYLVCLDPVDKPTASRISIPANPLYEISSRQELEDVMRQISSVAHRPEKRRGLSLPDEPLSDDEMDALLGRR